MTQPMAYDIVARAHMNWLSVQDSKSDPNSFRTFERFIKHKHWVIVGDDCYTVSDETAQKVRLLASPHFRTLLKAWEIQNETREASIMD